MTEATKKTRKSGSEQRQKQLLVTMRVTQQERDELAAHADSSGLTVSSYIRTAMLRRPQTRQTRKPPIERELLARNLAQLHKAGVNLHQLAKHLNFGGMPEAEAEYTGALVDFRAAVAALMETLGRSKPGDHQRRKPV